MFVTLIPAALDDFARVRLVFLDCSVCEEAHVIMYVKVKQWA